MTAAYIPLSANEAGTITASKTMSGGGIAALTDSRRDVVAYSASGAGPLFLNLDLGSAKVLQGIALLNMYCSKALTVEIQSDTTAGFPSPVTRFSATAIPTTYPDNENVYIRPTQTSARYWRIAISWTGSASVYLGELVATSNERTLSRNYGYGNGESTQAPITEFASRAGVVVREAIGGPRRTKRFTLEQLTRAQRLELQAMLTASAMGTRPILWVDLLGDAGSTTQLTDTDTQPSRCIAGLLEPAVNWTETDYRLFAVDELVLMELAPDARLP